MKIGNEDDLNPEKVIEITSGTHYTLFVTESGKLYGTGNRFLKEIGLDNDNKIIHIPLPEELKCIKAWGCMSK